MVGQDGEDDAGGGRGGLISEIEAEFVARDEWSSTDVCEENELCDWALEATATHYANERRLLASDVEMTERGRSAILIVHGKRVAESKLRAGTRSLA